MLPLRYLLIACMIGMISTGMSAQITYRVEDVPNVQLIDSTRFVTDPGDIIDEADEAALNHRLAVFRDSLQVEIAVVVLPAYDDDAYGSAREFAHELFNTWGIGDRETNRGLLIQLITCDEQREITFETGYGLEGELTDGLCKLIQTRRMIPLMKNGGYGPGLLSSLEEVRKVLTKESTLEAEEADEKAQKIAENERLIKTIAFIWWALGLAVAVSLLLMECSEARRATSFSKVKQTGQALNFAVIGAGLLFCQLPVALLYFLLKLIFWRQLRPRVKCDTCGAVGHFKQEKGYPIKRQKNNGTLKIYHYVCRDCGRIKAEKVFKQKENWGSGGGGGSSHGRDSSSRSSWSSGSSSSSRGGSWGGGSSGGGGASSRF